MGLESGTFLCKVIGKEVANLANQPDGSVDVRCPALRIIEDISIGGGHCLAKKSLKEREKIGNSAHELLGFPRCPYLNPVNSGRLSKFSVGQVGVVRD